MHKKEINWELGYNCKRERWISFHVNDMRYILWIVECGCKKLSFDVCFIVWVGLGEKNSMRLVQCAVPVLAVAGGTRKRVPSIYGAFRYPKTIGHAFPFIYLHF